MLFFFKSDFSLFFSFTMSFTLDIFVLKCNYAFVRDLKFFSIVLQIWVHFMRFDATNDSNFSFNWISTIILSVFHQAIVIFMMIFKIGFIVSFRYFLTFLSANRAQIIYSLTKYSTERHENHHDFFFFVQLKYNKSDKRIESKNKFNRIVKSNGLFFWAVWKNDFYRQKRKSPRGRKSFLFWIHLLSLSKTSSIPLLID